MVHPSVERATSDLLIGSDWAMNVEICDILNRDPGQAKDVVKSLKRRIRNKNPKIQLLALTLLETVVKNCGDIVQMHVAEKGVLHEMLKIVKKKPDPHVKEKILILIDTWQEACGGPRARYPQYFAAYQELLRAGATFPQRPERSAPIFTPQTQPLTSQPQSLRNTDHRKEESESSVPSDLPPLSLSEIQNARGIMDVLAEMLTALDPGNKEALRQDVIVDLVEQCRANKIRVVQLVNTTSDEELLCHGLQLNDDLQRVLIKHDALSSGAASQAEKPKPLQALIDVDDAAFTTQDNNQHQEARSSSGPENKAPFQQLLLPTPPAPNGPATPSAKRETHIDLLGEDFFAPQPDNSLALVPVSQEPTTTNPPSNQHNILALADMFSQDYNEPASLGAQSVHQATQPYPSTSQSQPQQQQQQPLQPQEPVIYSNESTPNTAQPQYEQTPYMQTTHPNLKSDSWNAQGAQRLEPQQQAFVYGANTPSSSTLPPPPWEAQPTQSSYVGSEHLQSLQSMSPPQSMQNNQFAGMPPPQTMQNSQFAGMPPPQSMQNSQFAGMPPPQSMPSGQLVGVHPPPMQNGHQLMYSQPTQTGALYPQQMQSGPSGGMYPQPMQSGSGPSGGMYPQQMPSGGGPLGGLYPQQMPSGGGPSGGMYPQQMQSSGGPPSGMYPQQMQSGQLMNMYSQSMQSGQFAFIHPHLMQSGQQLGMYPQPMQQGTPQMGMYPQPMQIGQPAAYSYAQVQGSSFLEQRLHGLSIQDDSSSTYMNPSYQTPSSGYQQPMRPAKSEDKLFGDLLDIAKSKPNKPNLSKVGSL